jgi:hypothetical protein
VTTAVDEAIAAAQASLPPQYPAFGRYLFEVQAIRTKEGYRGRSAIAELKVLKSEQSETSAPSRVGSTVSYVEKLNEMKKGGAGRFKAFLMALVGADPSELGETDSITKFSDDRQAGTFLFIEAEVYPKTLPAKDGRPGITLSAYRWFNVTPTAEQLAEIERKRAFAELSPLVAALS